MLQIFKTHSPAVSNSDDGTDAQFGRLPIHKAAQLGARLCQSTRTDAQIGRLFLLLLSAIFFPNFAWAMPILGNGEDGSQSNPYTINSADDWRRFATYIDDDLYNNGKYWNLTADIDLEQLTNNVGHYPVEFEGIFNGCGHTVTYTLTTAFAEGDYVGLFGATYNATIKNLKIQCGNFYGGSSIGVLIAKAKNSITIENVHIEQSGITEIGWTSWGAFIGGCERTSGNPTVLIENCSYINTGRIKFANTNLRNLNSGGFIGYLGSGYASVTLKDCMVSLSNVDFSNNANFKNFGGFFGWVGSNVTMIRCVQAGWPGFSTDPNKNRAAIAGCINAVVVSGIASYSYSSIMRGNNDATTIIDISGFTVKDTWNPEDVYLFLERRTNDGSYIPVEEKGNWRWSHPTGYLRLASSITAGLELNKNYLVQVIRGSGVSAPSNYDGSNNIYYYLKQGASTTFSPSPEPGLHQRVRYSITPSYEAGSHTPNATTNISPNISGTNNLELTTGHDVRVSAVFQEIPYPYTNSSTKANAITAEVKPFDSKITLNWTYDNPNNLTGKFYVYVKNSTESDYTNLTSGGLTLANGNSKTLSYDINGDIFAFNKVYDIYVGYWEGAPAPSLPTDIKAADRANASNISTTATAEMFGNWTVTATGSDNMVTVKMEGVDKYFTNSSAYSYKIQRSVKLSGTTNWTSYQDWLTNQSFNGVSTYTHDNTGITTPCDGYRYKVIISAFNNTFEKETGEAHSTGATAFLSQTSFKATKGEHANYVRLQWNVNRNGSGTDDVYKIFRRIANSESAWDELETVYSNAGTVYWNDNNALTGIFYEYNIKLYQNCTGTLTILSEEHKDIGFTQAFGVVSGRVTYGAGGLPVKDVNMLVTKNQLQAGEAQYHSLKSNGGGQAFEWLADSAYFNTIWTAKNWTLQFWLRPNGSNTGAAVIGYIGETAVSMQAVTGGYQIYTGFGTTYKSEIISSNKFSHITVTRNGDDMKIYTIVDANPDSVYIKNTPFTYSTATAQDSANCKISFGHSLKGNIDDVRFWNRALTEAEILRDHSRVLTGNEKGLKGYWTFDEGLTGKAFDRSRAGTIYNNNHATTVSLSSDNGIPETSQLALKGITDENGNYQINGIAYQGEGTSYSITPAIGSVYTVQDNGQTVTIDGRHVFNPTEQLRYVSPTSMVHNATDFTDISAFMVRGQVVYEGGNYPVTDCSFEVDDKVLTRPNGELVKSNNDGIFEITVPIGQHSVRVVKQGHTFAGDGYLKNADGTHKTYNAPVANVKFQDQTRVKLIGRVVGGNTEDIKPLAFGEAVNNIGVQTIELRSTRQAYNFSNTLVSQTYNHNNGQWRKPDAPLADDETRVDYNQKNVTIHLSRLTGEFSAMVYPEPYDIQPISVTQGNGQPVLVIKENAENIDLTATVVPDASYLQTETRTWKDSVYVANRPGVVDHWEYGEKSDTVRYNSKWTYKYQATPTFGVKQIENDQEVDYLGEKTFILKDATVGTSDTLKLYNDATQDYLFGKPVFQQGKKYDLRFNAYEQYTNFVSDPVVTATYPVISGSVNLTNNLQVTATPESYATDSTGVFNYRFTAGAPNLTTATGDIFATLTLGAVSYYWNMAGTGLVANNTSPLEAWQLGEKTTGTNFMTSGPDQLTAILRDPPGSGSSAFIESGSTVSSTSTTSLGTTVAEELNLKTSLGPKITTFVGLGAGVITEAEVKLDASVGLSSEQTYSSENEETTTTTFTERFETSSASDYVGAMGDVFIGNSTNILYGLTNGIQIQKGVTAGNTYAEQGEYKIASSAAIAYGQEFATRFAFTAMELENSMIPKWKNSIANRLQPFGTTVNTGSITAPVYVSKLEPTDENFGKWNLNKEAFGESSDFNLLNPYDGASYTIYFPETWTQMGEEMKNFQDSVLWANNQIEMWEAVLAQNEKEKVEMQHKGNYSFGGGSNIQYSRANTSNTSYTHSHGFNITPSLGSEIGGEVMGIGLELETKVSVKTERSSSDGSSVETSITTGFTLAEEGDDDEITVDYGETAGGTFAFKTRGGQTSCPYEGEVLSKYYQPGQHILQEATMRIEVPLINVASANQVLNVPANRTASFTLALQNESEINEDVWFQLIVDEITNPNGAELKIDGIGIGNGRTFLVKAGETLTKTLTVGKGTVDDYDNIGLILRSLCQADPTGAWEVIADTTWVSAHFVPACSDVRISTPANNFIVNTETGDVLSITLQDFDVNFPNFGYIRLEQRAAGTSTWSTVRTFYPTNLINQNNTDGTREDIEGRAAIVYDWDMASRADGQYELRATTASVNININVNNGEPYIVGNPLSTYSTTAITGYKDMVKPQAIGAPSPADGIYGAGDELSVTFNENVNTAMVISDNIVVTYGNNIPVPVTFVSSENKITIEYPSDYFSILEEQTLNITVSDIYDMRGNKSEPISWSAFVNRNALVWETDEINLVKEAGVSMQFTAKIKNAGNNTVSYSIVNLPQWLTASQPTGNLQPLTTRELTFTVSSGVNLGAYSEEIGLTSGNQITKNLPLNLTVTGTLPEGWTVNPADYESTMTVTGRLQITGAYQSDPADILAAFIGNECVGLTSPIKATESNPDLYTFLTIYGNAEHTGQAIKFKLWDASTGNVYSVIESKLNNAVQNFTFTANATHGATATPVVHNALNMIEQTIALENGWNWISANVLNTNPTIIQQFKDRIGTAGEMLKGQTGYIQNPSWSGTLTSIDKEKMYIVKTSAATVLHFDGTPADPATSPITLASGWNWIGYIPQFTLPVNEALNSLTATTNDQIKSHSAYRTYAGASVGWVGTLNYMRAGEGYMYNSLATANKTLIYPSSGSQVYQSPVMRSAAQTADNHWETNIYKYPNTMTMTSIVMENNVELHSDQIEVAAFDNNGECRGSIVLQNVPDLTAHPYLGFLMVFGNDGDNITLKVYDHAAGREYTAGNAVSFATDAIHGNPIQPYPIMYTTTGIDEIGIEQIAVYPNPAKDVLNIESGGLAIESVTIVDVLGRAVETHDRASLQDGKINVSNLLTGVYTIQITTKQGTATRKLMKK